ncbi:enoyl-CoA hydratase/carnithine racemase [Thermocatellispora tengchongensis]|uniref:Enoyl-CoA hydratase/carnithine racemase n=1 Tax=Thermocatellispora tengchongensis TaxID=1073253 RepID=A0A840NWI2_9ACTN|nr:hypothetical protein [Thermocatellispora tengchongensis]MBB5131169.1 enoyl-CoA hydratase/carnithine racemase [Thermocatellispora tengchongensis]
MAFTEIDYDVSHDATGVAGVAAVATITLNPPERLNAFTPAMRGELVEAAYRGFPLKVPDRPVNPCGLG